MKSIALVALAFMFTVQTASAQVEKSTVPSSILKEEYLFKVVRHLYRWYLDETDAEKIVGKEKVAFWVRELTPKLDPGDRSLFGEIIIPELDVKVTVKKADYAIEELGLKVKQDRFKIINVAKGGCPSDSGGYEVITTSYRAMRDHGHRTRALARFPEEALLMRMRVSAREIIQAYLEEREKAGVDNRMGTYDELKKKEQVLHLSPLSDVANEAWIFWETGRMLIHFASDIDLENPALWDHDELAVKLYNIDEQTVVSLDEVAGSNAYMTRDQVGRVLFNCVVLGRRLILQPSEETKDLVPIPSASLPGPNPMATEGK